MKFATAICFIMSGLIIFAIGKTFHGEFSIAPLVLSGGSLTIIIITSIFFASNFFKIPVGIEQLFVGEIFLKSENSSLQPCAASMLNLLLVAIVGIVSMFKAKFNRLIVLIVGIVIGLVGFSSFIGHILKIPFLYFDIYGVSSGMSVISGPLFIFIGISFYLLYSRHKIKNENQI